MAKQQYFVQHNGGSSAIIMASSFADAIKKCGWPAEEISSISLPKISTGGFVKEGNDGVSLCLVGTTISAPSVADLNNLLQRLGFKAVRATKNLLNPNGKKFFIDECECCEPEENENG